MFKENKILKNVLDVMKNIFILVVVRMVDIGIGMKFFYIEFLIVGEVVGKFLKVSMVVKDDVY